MLHERYSAQGLTILAFPCNQFRVQEPGSNFEVAASVAPGETANNNGTQSQCAALSTVPMCCSLSLRLLARSPNAPSGPPPSARHPPPL